MGTMRAGLYRTEPFARGIGVSEQRLCAVPVAGQAACADGAQRRIQRNTSAGRGQVMLFQTRFISPDPSIYGQHLLMVRMFGSQDPEVFVPRDYIWCETDGI